MMSADSCGPTPIVGAPWELRRWSEVDRRNCSCPVAPLVTARVGDDHVPLLGKECTLPMPNQRLPAPMRMASPRSDVPAYVAYEIDRGDYGKLRSLLRGRQNGRRSRPSGAGGRFIDIGANLGFLSVALAIANPDAHGVAFEPNPSTFAFLQRNLQQNGVADRVLAVNAGVTRDGRALQMPRCLIMASEGTQMATTQWKGRTSVLQCFSNACKEKQQAIRRCMANDPRMISLPSVRFDVALSKILAPRHRTASGTALVDLLKVDCEGC